MLITQWFLYAYQSVMPNMLSSGINVQILVTSSHLVRKRCQFLQAEKQWCFNSFNPLSHLRGFLPSTQNFNIRCFLRRGNFFTFVLLSLSVFLLFLLLFNTYFWANKNPSLLQVMHKCNGSRQIFLCRSAPSNGK